MELNVDRRIDIIHNASSGRIDAVGLAEGATQRNEETLFHVVSIGVLLDLDVLAKSL